MTADSKGDTMIVSPSEIRTYKRCKRRWRYYSSNASNLEPFTTHPAFILGTVVHKALGEWLKSPNTDMPKLVQPYYMEYIHQLEQEYEQRLNIKPSTTELQPLFDDMQLATSMMVNYQQYYGTPIPKNLHLLDTEQEIQVDIPGGKHQLLMRIDGLLTDNSGQVYILEHKTYDQKPNPLALAMDEQFTAYVWGCNQLGLGRVVGLVYDGMWKRATAPEGRTFEELFNRQILFRSKLLLMDFERELISTINDMISSPEYKTVPWNGCGDCSYTKLCLAETNHEDVEYVRDTFYRQKHSRDE